MIWDKAFKEEEAEVYCVKLLGDWMEFEDIVKSRYAAKKFSGEKIEPEKIGRLKEIIRLAPSSFNLQPWKVKVVEDKDTLEKLQEAAYGQPQVGTCSHLFVFCANSDVGDNLRRLKKGMGGAGVPAEKVEGFSKMVEPWVSQMDEEQKKNWARGEVFLAVENALLGAKSLGFDSCPMGGFDAAKFSQILGLGENLTPVCIVPVGIAADEAREKLRFSKEEVFF